MSFKPQLTLYTQAFLGKVIYIMYIVVCLPYSWCHSMFYIWMSLLRLPKALDPTLVGTKLFLPTAPDLLRKSARRWVTQVAVLQALFCAVTLLFKEKKGDENYLKNISEIQIKLNLSSKVRFYLEKCFYKKCDSESLLIMS